MTGVFFLHQPGTHEIRGPVYTGSAPERRWPMVARHNEFRRALAALGSGTDYQGVALVGDTGVGKSTLARALGEALESDGQTVRFVLGTQTGCDVPLGAFSRSVTVDAAREPTAMLAAAHRALEGYEGLVLVVDDVQLLDPLSATLVHQLAVGGGVRLVVTIRSGEPVFDAVSGLLNERLLTLHIDAFTAEQTGELARSVLGGAVESRLIAELQARSGGNLLFLRGLLSAGRESGVLVHTEDGWHLRGPLRADRELTDLIEFRLRSLTSPERHAVEILAVGELLDWEILSGLCDAEAVAHLEQRGLILLVADGPDLVARLHHPVIGEAAVRLAGAVRARQLNGILAQAFGAHIRSGGRRLRLPDVRGRIRLAQFIMGSDLEPDLDAIIAAAASAMTMSNLGWAEELARFAHQRGAALPAALVLADALSWRGRGVEAEALLADALPADADEALIMRWASSRVANLVWTCGDLDAGRRALAGVTGRLGSEAGRGLVAALEIAIAFFCGDPAPAIELGPALCEPDVPPLTTVWAAVAAAYALAVAGRPDDVSGIAEAGVRAAARTESALQQFVIGVAEVMALTARGEAPAAGRVAERYAAIAAGLPEAEALVDGMFGLVLLARGQLAAACSALRESSAVLSGGFPSIGRVVVGALAAQAEGARGNAVGAASALRCAEQAYGPHTAVFLPELELGRAWERASAGQISNGRAHAVHAAQIAQRSDMWAVEMRALHTAVRLGDRSHAARLGELARTLDTALAQAVAGHARGLANRSGDLLDTAADGFFEIGALALAADAAAQAALAHARSGNRGRELESSTRAHWLASQGEIRTPAVNAAAQPLPVTDREREIAMLAATGLSNRQIADRLSVSVRTVDGHLYRIFAKLGIDRRDQLVRMFGVVQSGS